MNEEDWDAKYEENGQMWSGRPNGALTVEVADLMPGQALDVGCGEGADARWLAAAGWRVTAVDVSKVALERAAEQPHEGEIAWKYGDLINVAPPPRSFDLVSAQYFPLPRTQQKAAYTLIDAVSVGGTLLYVGHDFSDFDVDAQEHEWTGPDPRSYFMPADLAELLDDDWEIQVNESRPRVEPPSASAHFINDLVLRARRIR